MQRCFIFLLWFFNMISNSSSQAVRSIHLSIMADSTLNCLYSACQPLSTVSVTDLRTCQLACLSEPECSTLNFYIPYLRCEIFNKEASNAGVVISMTDSLLMTVIDGTRITMGKFKRLE